MATKKLKILALSVTAAMAVAGIMAASAFAVSPSWQVGGTEFTGTESVSSVQETSFVLKSAEIGFTCTSEASTGSIKETSKDELPGGISFTVCSVNEAAKCTVRSERGGVKDPIGTITTVPLKTRLIKVGTKFYDIFEPTTGTLFTTIVVEGGECGLTGKYEVTGVGAGEIGPAAVEGKLTSSEAVSTAAGVELKLKAKKAILTGTAKQKLTGANKGKTIGVA